MDEKKHSRNTAKNDTSTAENDANETESTEPNAREAARDSVGGREDIRAMRNRLYARGTKRMTSKRTPLSKRSDTEPVARSWDHTKTDAAEAAQVRRPATSHSNAGTVYSAAPSSAAQTDAPTKDAGETIAHMSTAKKKGSYRTKLVLAGLIFFVVAMALSSAFIWFGGNTISGENISINISDEQLTVGGGEELSFQVSVANQNAVPIESATLIVNYPPGTQSAENSGEELFSQRIQLDTINSGEAVNVPVNAVIFGEENQEKTINAALEYRVRGSNATFFKEAKPLRLKISSSPVTLTVESVERISSGQEMEFTLTVTSNSPNPVSNLLVKASYPSGFDFSESSIETASGQDTWRIDSLEPEEEISFTVRGLVVGSGNEEKVFRFSIGVPNERDPFNIASTLSNTEVPLEIEAPFLDIGIAVNGNTNDDPVIIETDETADIDITITNTQNNTLYDGVITAELQGNAVREVDVVAAGGYYDSTTNTATWDSVDRSALSEIPPGQSSLVRLRLTPEEDIARTPEITLNVSGRGQRVFENRVPEKLSGSATRVVRIESSIELTTEALYSVGEFTNTGPVPPVAEEVTQYTLNFELENGSNDVTDARVSAVLPQNVTWLDLKTPGDDITYDTPTRTLTWDIGDLDANGRAEASVQVSLTPSFSQVGKTPTLLETARFRATDRFTGTVLRADTLPITTRLKNDPDEDTHDGVVREDADD